MATDQGGKAQAALQLLDGQAGLHELGLTGRNQVVGFLDADLTEEGLEPFVAARLGQRLRGANAGRTHGDQMATALIQAGPGARLLCYNVFNRHGVVTRDSIATGMAALRADPRVRLINVSLQIKRIPQRCSSALPCTACRCLRDAVDAGLIVVVAGGNQGPPAPGTPEEAIGTVTCPAAESGALIVAATTGPPGSSENGSEDGEPVSGTSVSSAMTTGSIALLLEAFPDLTATALRAALEATATALPNVPRDAVGFGRPHYFRAFRWLEHRRSGGCVDIPEAERLANAAIARLGAVSPAQPLGAVPADVSEDLERALALAPWSSQLHLWRGLVAEGPKPHLALLAGAEAVRLEWAQPGPHLLLSRLLARRGDARGAAVEERIARLLEAGDPLKAADALFAAQAG